MTSEKSLYESEAVTPTKTALVLDLADGRTVELTAHVRTPRDSGLRAIEERDPENDEGTDSQRCFDAASTTLILRDLDAEDDDPIGLLPTDDLDVDGERAPDGWELLGRETVAGKIGDPFFHNPVWEHESGEAWVIVTRRFEDREDVFHIELEAGDPSSGIWPIEETDVPVDGTGATGVQEIARKFMAGYDHGGDS